VRRPATYAAADPLVQYATTDGDPDPLEAARDLLHGAHDGMFWAWAARGDQVPEIGHDRESIHSAARARRQEVALPRD
jgi:hypothetical protein